nr:hypothetical protein [Tanacetum cinerariifolium]
MQRGINFCKGCTKLGSHLRIEESLRVQDNDKPKGNNVAGLSVVNMVEHNNSSKYNDNKGKRKHHDTRANPNKKPKDDDVAWWVDSGATVHVCKDRCWFKTYELLNDGSILHMGNESIALVHGCGCVYLRLGHVHFKMMQDMSKDGLIPAIDMDTKEWFWDEAMLTACYLLNRVPDKKNMTTPYELWTKKKPTLSYLRVWGCRVAVRLLDPKLKTLGERDIKCIFVGYAEHSKAFRFYVIKPNDSVSINSIIESRDAIFNEQRFSSVPRPSQRSLVKGTEDSETRDEVSDQHSYCFNVEDDPKTFDEAMKSQDVAFGKETINDEMDSIMGNNTWVLTDLPPGCKPLGCTWIFKRKLKMDVKTAFLNGNLELEAPKQWYQKFDKVVLSNGYLLNQADKCGSDQGIFVIKVLYKGHGGTYVILCIRIKHESNGIAISQSHYIDKVLKKINYSDCTPVSTHLDTCEKLMPNKGLAVSQLEYSRVVGCLMYVMNCTRPDIAFVMVKLSRYTSNPRTQHWQAIQRVLKYLKKTMNYRLVHFGYPSVLEGNTDASWISNTEDNSSISGWVFLLGGGAISWASKKQTCITSSTMESKFVALAVVGKEAKWLKNLLLEIPMQVKPMALVCV